MTSKNYIVYIVREPVGGIWKHLEILVKYFKLKYKIIIIGDLSNGDTKFLLFKEKYIDIEYLDIPILRQPSLSDYKNIMIIKKYLEDKNIDVIHGHGAKGGIYARALGLFTSTKIIYTPHGGSVHSSFGKVQTLFYKIIESLMYFLTDRVVVESKYTDEKYQKILFFNTQKSRKIILNYNGIDCQTINDKYTVKKFNNPIVISSFGMLRYVKGQDILINAVKKLIDEGLMLRLNIYGEGDSREEYQALIEANSLKKYVFLHGETDQVESKMKESDIVIQPSRFESFGYVLLEAMCVGIPIIASNTGGMSEIMEHRNNGLIFKNEDIDSLAEEIRYMIANESDIENYIIEGKNTIVSRFSSKSMCDNLNKIYKEK